MIDGICAPVLESIASGCGNDNEHVLKLFSPITPGVTILLTSVQPVLSDATGIAVGSGWQAYVAYINLGCYYVVGLPLGFLMGWAFHLGFMGIWGGMIFGGTAVQTVILAIITVLCDWEKEAQKAKVRVAKWSTITLEDDESAPS